MRTNRNKTSFGFRVSGLELNSKSENPEPETRNSERRKHKEVVMGVTVGSGDYRYEVIEGWVKLPDGWTFREVAAVALDKKDQIYAFTRGQHPITVFDRDGNFLRSWGAVTLKRAHGAPMGPEETSCSPRGVDHTVGKCSL